MKNVYFIGIGGIGMSAIARYYNVKGYAVSGYDKTPSARFLDASTRSAIMVRLQLLKPQNFLKRTIK